MHLHPITRFCLTVTASVMVAVGARAAPVISEILYNPPGSSEASFEWFEIYNPGPGELDISGLVVESRAATNPRLATVPAGTTPLPQGGYAVLTTNPLLGISCHTADPTVILGGDFGLGNSAGTGDDNPRIALFPPGTTDVTGTPLDVVGYLDGAAEGGPFPTSTDGVAIQLVDLGADNSSGAQWRLAPAAAAGCAPYATNASAGQYFGTPGRPNDWCYRAASADAGTVEDAALEDASLEDAGSSSAEPVCLTSGFDAGLVDSAVAGDGSVGSDGSLDGGTLLDVGSIDLGPQNPPTIALSQPAGSVTANPSVDVVYAASDPDGDALGVALFYAEDDSGADGVLIADSLPAQGTYSWTPLDVPAGTYRVFGRATDARGGLAYAYAAGSVTVPPASVELPRLTIVAPTGSEGEVREPVEIAFTHNDLPGTIDLFYDVDSSGNDGQPIIGGIAVPGGPTRVKWNIAEVPAGTYFVHGRYQTGTGVATAYSPGSVTVVHDAEGCGCRAAAAPGGAAGILVALTCFLLRRRRLTTWR